MKEYLIDRSLLEFVNQRRSIVVALLVGMVVGAGAIAVSDAGWSLDDGEPNTASDAPDPGLATASSGPTCLNESIKPHGGWVHTVAHDDRYDVTFNATIAHDRSEAVDVNLSDTGFGVYEIQFETHERTSTSATTNVTQTEDCETGTTITAGGSIPSEFKSIRVTVNGEVIQTVEKDGTFPVLRQLPNPIET